MRDVTFLVRQCMRHRRRLWFCGCKQHHQGQVVIPVDARWVNPVKGPYKHFKGGNYYVFAVGKHTETMEVLVMYSVIGDTSGDFWVRPVSMWNEEVEWPDGVMRPRFIPHSVHLGRNPPD